MERSFWRGRRVFVTGNTGFKGSWLCAWLAEAGASIHGFALAPSTEPSLFDASGLAQTVASTLGDVRDAEAVTSALVAADPQIVFHLAAQPLVRSGYDAPAETFAVNVGGTANVLAAVRRAPSVGAVIVVTSDKCYEPAGAEHRHAEDDRLGGEDPYSASKACAELVTAAFRRSFFTPGAGIATARAGNVIGGGDWAKDRLLPDLMRAFGSGGPASIRRPDAIRPWQHVLDPLGGYVRLAESLAAAPEQFSGAWNFGPPASHEVDVGRIADAAARVWGRGARWIRDAAAHPHESAVLRLDSTKAQHELGWSARVPLVTALSWTVDWHRGFLEGRSARRLMLSDIARFEAMAA